MGKKSKKREKCNKERYSIPLDEFEETDDHCCRSAKQISKNKSKLRSKAKNSAYIENKQNKSNSFSWHEVNVKVKSGVEKIFLLNSIGNYVDIAFCPLGYHRIDDEISFYFEKNTEVASAINSLNKRIQSESGETMSIKVKLVENPAFFLNVKQIEILKEVVIKRYNPDSQLLDLTCLYLDHSLVNNDIFVPLDSPIIMKQVLRIIRNNFNDKTITALNLSKNMLTNGSISLLQSMNSHRLKALNLESNKISSIHFVKFLQMFPIQELNISLNKVESLIKNNKRDLLLLRRDLPSLTVLDGIPISNYSNSSESNCIKPSILTETSSQDQIDAFENKIKLFLEHYFTTFDLAGRPNLLAAYTESSKVEILSENSAIPSTLFENQTEIQSFLVSFPDTKHILSSFNFDIFEVKSTDGCVKITGMCEVKGFEKPLLFQRTMKIIAYNSGLCCSLDSLQIK